MSKERINMRKFAKSLRFISRVELKRLCRDSGMTDREIQGTVDYIYDRKSTEEVAESLCLSIGTFQTRKETLALRLANYLKSIDYHLIDFDYEDYSLK